MFFAVDAALEAKVKQGEEALEQAQVNVERGRVELSRAIKDKEMYKGFLDSYEAEEKTLKHDDVRGQRIEVLFSFSFLSSAETTNIWTRFHT